MPRLALNPGSRPRRPGNDLIDLAADVQAELAEVERDAAPLWPAASRKSDRVKAHCLTLARLLRIARSEARDLTIAAEAEAAGGVAA